MAADILLYDAEIVPVGKDQLQDLEITRDIASRFNHKYPNSFILPESRVDEKVMIVPGTDGNKMSKSYNNCIDIFVDDKQLRKQIMKIQTDSISVSEPKNPETCNVFKLLNLLSNSEQSYEMKKKYLAGGIGYGDAKQELFELICNNFYHQRRKFVDLMNNKEIIDIELKRGADKAKNIANNVLERVREKYWILNKLFS